MVQAQGQAQRGLQVPIYYTNSNERQAISTGAGKFERGAQILAEANLLAVVRSTGYWDGVVVSTVGAVLASYSVL